LKRLFRGQPGMRRKVAPRRGAWIETTPGNGSDDFTESRPPQGGVD